MAKQKKKGGCGTIFIILIILVLMGLILKNGDKKEVDHENDKFESVSQETLDSVWAVADTDINEFDYYTNGNEIHLKRYKGDSTKIRINSRYDIEGKGYSVVSLEDATFFCSDVASVIIPDGVRHIDNNTFNSSDIAYLYLPSTLEKPDDTFWGYFHDVEKIYYGGTNEQWNKICQKTRSDLEVKQIYCNVNPDDLGTEKSEIEVVVMNDTTSDNGENFYYNEEIEQQTSEDTNIPWDNKLQSDLKSILSEDVANKAYDVLVKQIGFSNIKYIGRNSVGEFNFDFEADSFDFTMTAGDDVYRVFQPSGGAVFYEDGAVKQSVADLENKIIDSSSQSAYYIIAKEIVESCLVNPKSADFPTLLFSSSDITMQRKGDIVGVQSYVDSKNALGAVVRNEWLVEFQVIDLSSFSYNTLYVQIDGEKSGEFVDLN